MPRKPRNFQKGLIYHITSRGVDGRKIFLTPKDYSRFILALEFYNSKEETSLWDMFFHSVKKEKEKKPVNEEVFSKKIRVKINKERMQNGKREKIVHFLAFSLMPNHFHLVLREIEEGGIISFMRKMGGYSVYFNKQYKRTGALFQSRYHSSLVEGDDGLISTLNYVHTNPVELWEPEWREGRVKNYKKTLKNLYSYKYSSLLDYVGKRNYPSVTSRGFFLDSFGGTSSYKKSVENWILKKGEIS